MDFLSRFKAVRELLRKFRTPPPPGAYDVRQSRLVVPDVARVIDDIEKDGIALGLRLPGDLLEELVDYAHTATCYGNGKPQFGFRYAEKAAAERECERVFSQAVFFDVKNAVPAIGRLSRDPLLMAIAARHLGAPPVCTSSRLWWTFATESWDYDYTGTSSFFHFDKDDFASVRFFFYLTDVDEGNGPHRVVKTSHKKKKLSHLISPGVRDADAISETYGQDNIVTICGNAGMGFAEDPFCFHRATRPVTKDRLVLQLRFATKGYNVVTKPDPSVCRNILEGLEQEP